MPRESETKSKAQPATADPEGDRKALQGVYTKWTKARGLLSRKRTVDWYGRIGFLLGLALSVVALPVDALVQDPSRPGVAVLLLHGMAFCGVALHAIAGARQTRAAGVALKVLFVPIFLLLLPAPLVPLLGCTLYYYAIPKTVEETLTGDLGHSTGSVSRFSRWLDLEGKLQLSSQGERGLGTFERRLLWLCNIKSAVLVFDGAALAGLLYKIVEDSPPWQLAIRLVFGFAVTVSISLGIGGLLRAAFLSFRAPATGRPEFLAPFSSWLFLGATQLAWAAGLLMGGPLEQGDGHRVGEILLLASVCGFGVSFLRISRHVPRRGRSGKGRPVLWSLLFGFTSLVGYSMISQEESRAGHLFLLQVCVAFLPWSVPLLAIRQFLDALLRPFRPCDILSRDRPVPLRAMLFLLTLSVALPLGGLAVPAWPHFSRYLKGGSPEPVRSVREPPGS